MNRLCFTTLALILLAACQPAQNRGQEQAWSYLFKKNVPGNYLLKGEGGDYDWSNVFHIPQDGVLSVTGKGHPIAWIQTKKQYENFELQFDFRWPDEPGNSGIQLYSTDTAHFSIWPQCIEVQMAHNNVGAFWLLGQSLDANPKQIPENTNLQNKRNYLLNAEKPAGQWNHMKIIALNNTLEVYLNGTLVNKGWNTSHSKGKITIQAEESNIDYREFKIRAR